ncbi:lactate permease LctP family transporter [Streptomyces noursei]|uniref:L-lactate permease n=1 Tax=Streptomyces noursei TaxID=1971 RepID=UPI00331BA99E
MYQQSFDALGGSTAWSALAAALPLAVTFVLIGAGRLRSHHAVCVGLLSAAAVAAGYGMPPGQVLSAAAEGAAYGLVPLTWIVVNALWIHRMTVDSGHFAVLRRSFAALSADRRVQALVIAFCLGSLLEALAGFGTPVAIAAAMLIALGFAPFKAVAVALVANAATAAYGAMGTPVVTLGRVTGLPAEELGAVIGRQAPLVTLLVPFVLVWLTDRRRGLREAWEPALVCGVAACTAQVIAATLLPVELVGLVSALTALGAVLVWARLRHRQPTGRRPVPRLIAGGSAQAAQDMLDRARVLAQDGWRGALRGCLPYLIVVAVFGVAQTPWVHALLRRCAVSFRWPGLLLRDWQGGVPAQSVFTLEPLSGGTLLLLAGLVSVAALRIRPGRALRAYRDVLRQLRHSTLTVSGVLAMAYVMGLSGQTAAIGHAVAATGGVMAALSPVLGWLGTAVTGSATSANALFGSLQSAAAQATGLPVHLLAAANDAGASLGKPISPQNLAIAAAVAELHGAEGRIFRSVVVHSAALLALLCLLVYLESTPLLSWLLP